MAFRIDDPPVNFIPIRGMVPPTRQDTTDLVNRSEAVRQFVENAKNAEGKPMYRADVSKTRQRSMPKSQVTQKQQNARNAAEEREKKQRPVGIIKPSGAATMGVMPLSEYARQLSPTKYEQREVENMVINPEIPMGLYDARIAPDTVYQFRQNDGPDLVSIPGYSTRLLGKPQPIVQPVARPPQRVPRQKYGPRVSFGTSNNRPTNQPGVGGKGGWWNPFK